MPILADLFTADFQASKAKRAPPTVGRTFTLDVANLLNELSSTRPFFIRCIKPNTEKQPQLFDTKLVLTEMRCGGVMGAVALMQQTYPTRVPYDTIYKRVRGIVGDELVDQVRCSAAVFCEKVMQVIGQTGSYALGRSKLFLRAGGGTFLQDLAAMDPAELIEGMTHKLAFVRRMLGVSMIVVYTATKWRRRTFAKYLVAVEIMQWYARGRLVRKRYFEWSEDRKARIAAEALRLKLEAEAAEAARREEERLEALRLLKEEEVQKKLKTVTRLEEQAQRQTATLLENQAQEEAQLTLSTTRTKLAERKAAIAASKGGLSTRRLWLLRIAMAVAEHEADRAARAHVEAEIAADLDEGANRLEQAEVQASLPPSLLTCVAHLAPLPQVLLFFSPLPLDLQRPPRSPSPERYG